MANYNLTQTFADGQTHTATFTIPETAGTYQITAVLTNVDGTTRTINAGTVVVAAKPNTYNVEFDMGNSTSLSTTLTTPALGATMTIPAMQQGIDEIEYGYMDQNNVNQLAYAAYGMTQTIQVMPGTTVSYAIVTTSSDFIPYNTSDVVNYDVGDDVTSGTFPTVYAQYNGTPTIRETTSAATSISVDLFNGLSSSVSIALYYSDLPQGTYSLVGYTDVLTSGNTGTITKTGLSLSTTYYFKASYYDAGGNIKEGTKSAYTSATTSANTYTVTIPARRTGISTLSYSYVDATGKTVAATAGTTSKTITVQAGSTVKRTGYTLSNTTYYQFYSGNQSSWVINSNYTLPAQYAQYKGTPTITSTATTQTTATIRMKNTLGTSVYLVLYKATASSGTYTVVGSTSSTVANNSTGSVTASSLNAGTNYYFKAAYYDPTGQVINGAQSSYTKVTTDPEETT